MIKVTMKKYDDGEIVSKKTFVVFAEDVGSVITRETAKLFRELMILDGTPPVFSSNSDGQKTTISWEPGDGGEYRVLAFETQEL